MTSRRRVMLAHSAAADLEDLRDWYTAQGAPAVGDRLIREVVGRIEHLSHFPESGRVVPEFGVPWLREVVHPPFRIVYRVDEERVRVVRIWRSERLMKDFPAP